MAGAPVRFRARTTAAVLAVVALILSVAISWAPPASAADEYPTWDDVKKVRADEAKAKALKKRIEQYIVDLENEVARTEADAIAKGEIYHERDAAFQEAAFVAEQLQKQADVAQEKADESKRQAGQLFAQLARAGGNDLSASLFANPQDADELLSNLGFASKISEQANSLYEMAIRDQNTAQSLTDQANVAKEIREERRAEAEAAFEAAQEAANRAQAALSAQQDELALLRAQLVVLEEEREATEADYREGERKRLEEQANNPPVNGGWARPSGGYISSSWGYRVDPVYGGSDFHTGVDLAASCGAGIYAASSGTVEYAGWNGGYGYYVRINHGGGLATAYGHIQSGGILVSHGQVVIPGQQIARVGTTGKSTGCHLHFEVRQNGISKDPVPFMRNKGVALG